MAKPGTRLIPVNNKPQQPKLSEKDGFNIPLTWLPSARTGIAIQNGCERNLLFNTWGGLGDQVCAEPAIRYAMKHFKDCKFTLASERPELFQHLNFERSFDLNYEQPFWNKYFVFRTIQDVNHIQWEFMSHMLIQAVDYVSLCMFRLMMPIEDRAIRLEPKEPQPHIMAAMPDRRIVVHAGRHWQSKTFPKKFWDATLLRLTELNITPILIGANTDDNRGTVDVNTDGCIDLRNQTNINDLMWICKNAHVVLTNDSSPLHIAAAGNAHIGFIATCKHPDYITHYRRPFQDGPNKYPVEWGWRMKNFGRGGIWDHQNYCPNVSQAIEVDKVDLDTLNSWLPDPDAYANWAWSALQHSMESL